MKRSCRRRLLLLALLVVVVLLVWPVTAHAFSTLWFFPEERLTTNESDQRWPEISGTKVVIEDYRNQRDVGDPYDPTTLYDIRVLNLATKTSKTLTPYHTAVGRPAISGDHVVWEDYGHGSVRGGIYFYDLKTGVRTRLPISSGRELRVSGDRVVYEAYRSGHWRIYVFNLSTWRESLVTTDGAIPGAPDISGKRVVWQDFRDGNHEIYAKDLGTGVTTRVTNDPARQTLPRISGTKIVWIDERNGALNDDIYCYDLSTGVERQITTDPAKQWFPAIDANRIVWMDERHGDTEIYLFDLVSGAEMRVTSNTAYQGNPSIDGDRIVYDDHLRPGTPGMDVYLTRVAPPRLTSRAPSVVDYGARAAVEGTLTSAGGTAISGRPLVLEISYDGSAWSAVGVSTTALDGTYSVLTPQLMSRRYVRVRYLGDAQYAGATSNVRAVMARLEFTDPPRSSTYEYRVGTSHAVWGYFRPKHTGGSHQIKIRAYRYQRTSSGWKWVHRFTFTTTVSNPEGSEHSKYAGSVRLPYTGRWRLRAYHAEDSRNAATWSASRDITVR